MRAPLRSRCRRDFDSQPGRIGLKIWRLKARLMVKQQFTRMSGTPRQNGHAAFGLG